MPNNEVRCTYCNKLLIKDNEIKCPRCKELIRVFNIGENGLKIGWPENKQSLNELKNVLEKWPVELQKEFISALDTFQRSLGASYYHEHKAEVVQQKISIKPEAIFSGQEINRLSATLKKFGIIPNLKYLREDMEYFKLGLQLVNFFAGINKPDGEKVPLVNVFGFLNEPAKINNEPIKAENPVEAYIMAYWERNMGKFEYTYNGKRVFELKDRDAKRNAIIILTKKFSKKLQSNFTPN